MHFNIDFRVASFDDLLGILKDDVKDNKLPQLASNFIIEVAAIYPHGTAFHIQAFGELDTENVKDTKISVFVSPISFRQRKE